MVADTRLSGYLQRIGLARPAAGDAQALQKVQAAHRQSIPFENLSVRLGKTIACDGKAAFAKLVEQQRGGFCFEQNQLFADMLGALDFEVRLLLARVLLGRPDTLPPRTHCLVLVRLDGADWIADAGFGGSYAPPMPLRDRAQAETDDTAQHRLRHIGPDGALPGAWVLERKGPVWATDGRTNSDSEWEPQYAFDLAEVAPTDMALGCHWSATHPTSRFTNLTVVSRCLPDGFVSLVDRELTRWRTDKTPRKGTLETVSGYAAVLREEFGLDLPYDEVSRLPIWSH